MRRLPIPDAHRKARSPQPSIAHALPVRNSTDSLAAQPSSGSVHDLAHAPQGHAHGSTAGLMQKSQQVSDVLQRAKEKNEEDDWDGDFADVSFSNKLSRGLCSGLG